MFLIFVSVLAVVFIYYTTENLSYFIPIHHVQMPIVSIYLLLSIASIIMVVYRFMNRAPYFKKELINQLSMFIIFVFIPYLTFLFVAIDSIYLVTKLISNQKLSYDISSDLTLIGLVGVVYACIYGHFQSKNIKIMEYDINVDKISQNIANLRVALISDLHISSHRESGRAKRFVKAVNKLEPDLVLLAGDVFDNANAEPIIKSGNAEYLSNFNARYGTYYALGNHEYYGDSVTLSKYIDEQLKVNMLIDKAMLIEDSFYVVGRADYKSMFGGIARKKLPDLLSEMDTTKPIILIDHQPHDLDEIVDNNVDVATYGHTHNGQYWPFNYIVQNMYKLAHGYLHEKNSHMFVSSGLGEWGPRFRLGTQSEIVIINMHFKTNDEEVI